MSYHSTTELIIAAIVGSGGLLPLIRSIVIWWGRRRHQSGLRSIQKIYQNLNVLMTGLFAHRVAIFDSCNGGATPKAGSQLHVQTIYEINSLKTPHGRGMWNQRTPVNPELLDKLITIHDGQPHSWLTIEMPEGPLKVMAEAMDSDKVILQQVGIDSRCMKVLAVFLPTQDELLPPQEQLLTDVASLLKTVSW